MSIITKNTPVVPQITKSGNNPNQNSGLVSTNYEENLNMYTQPPQNVISLHDFQSLALERLQVLKKIEFMHDSNASTEDINQTIFNMTLQHRFAISAAAGRSKYGYIKPEDRAEFKNNDNISHFICRLAYCRNEELRKWFLTQESRLF